MHTHLAVPAAAELQRLLELRLARRQAVQRALLDALFGVAEVAALDRAGRRRLQALLEARSDDQLEAIARCGSAGQSVLRLELDLLFDGVPTAGEQQAMLRRLRDFLRTGDWYAGTLALRGALLTEGPAKEECAGTLGSPACP